jgi:hypothetical protein
MPLFLSPLLGGVQGWVIPSWEGRRGGLSPLGRGVGVGYPLLGGA